MSSEARLWQEILEEAREEADGEPVLSDFLKMTLLERDSLEDALAFHLAQKLATRTVTVVALHGVFSEVFAADAAIGEAVRADLRAVRDRDPACNRLSVPLLYFKGFHALQAYRVAHSLWSGGRRGLAQFVQNRISQAFGVDIHPAARIGRGIFIDHGTGVVVGETAVIEDDVSLLQDVTLGGTGKESGDRHPKVRAGVLISAGAKVLGNIEIGEGAKIGAGSVVLKDVPPHTTAVGVPARIVGSPREDRPALAMDQSVPPFGGEGI
ncbi:MAG: serine O-acetyltransferase [Deltaproteobacteria bacterium]|nr:serine O-acetyltransferase [Deltaproteobacteria bacterium]MBW2360715.1 serine O-acetyltransferase [Deltaproteobacteria bacterium]